MSVIDLIGTQTLVGIGLIGSFLFMISIGLFGKWFPYRSNIVLVRNPSSYIVAKRKLRDTTPILPWERDQQDWLRSCFGAIFLIVLFSIIGST